jgi:4-diphosphocytidyl-2-C-methyl-D-erythritol kinase
MKARAKINLFLHVNEKLANNYHLLESMVAFADDAFDEITITNTNDNKISLSQSGIFSNQLGNEHENIIFKTASLLQTFKPVVGCNIKLVKNLPVASGMGGGSSDAATTIHLLNKLWDLNLTADQIKETCLKIGSDVYPCFNNRPAYFSGMGEKIENLTSFPKVNAVLINPLKTVITKDIFQQRAQIYSDIILKKPLHFHNQQDLIEFLFMQKNDFQDTTIKQVPEISMIIDSLNNIPNCLLARMSGTGATCFGIFNDSIEAENAASQIMQQYPEWWVKATNLS